MIIGLSSGYAIALIVGLVFGCIKCLKFTELKISQWRENKRENTEPDPMHLRVMQQRVQQLQPSTTTSLSIILEKAFILHIHMHILHLSSFTALL